MSDQRVLVVSAHPDDIEFGCAGTVAKWTDEGADVTYCIVTDGSTGTPDAELAGTKLATIRRDETNEAAKIAGVTDVRFLDYRDGYVEYTLDLRRDIARVFRDVRPTRYIVMDPEPILGGWFVNHPDHRAVAHASLDVTVTAGTTPGHFPELIDEGFEPWRGLREVYVTGPAGGNHAVDITSTIDRKIEALKAHRSQIDWDVDPLIRNWAKTNGQEHGFEYAELFRLLPTMEARRSEGS
jgi:LmbE family N-acetylglucosaminyl deacetylase